MDPLPIVTGSIDLIVALGKAVLPYFLKNKTPPVNSGEVQAWIENLIDEINKKEKDELKELADYVNSK